jgi:hypothetical protein
MDKDVINLEEFMDDLNEAEDTYIYIGDRTNPLYAKYKDFFDYLFNKLETDLCTELDSQFSVSKINEIDFNFYYYLYEEATDYVSNSFELPDLETEVKWTIHAVFSGGGDDGDIEITEFSGLETETDETSDLSDDFICRLVYDYITRDWDWINNSGGNGNCTWNHETKTFSYDLELYEQSYMPDYITSNDLMNYVLQYNER